MISVVCPKTTKRCNLPHFLAPFPENYSKDPLILKSYQAAFGKNPSPTHLSSEGKAGHPALIGTGFSETHSERWGQCLESHQISRACQILIAYDSCDFGKPTTK